MSAGMIAISRVISRRSHGRSRMLRKPSITIWPASVPVSVAFWPENSSASANSVLASVRAEQRRQQQVGVGDVGDPLVAGSRGTSPRPSPGWRRSGTAPTSARRSSRWSRSAPPRAGSPSMSPVLARLDDRRVQVEVVRHHRRAEDADRDVEHVGIARRSPATARARRSTPPRSGRASAQLDRERAGDPEDQQRRPAPRRSGSRNCCR